ncbi:MAG: hypothetical protein JXA71_03185 [Chitinispirillaceae bacterium]|nr:hypothetical protein [Chitinispirillaceae bacterium]
MLHFPHYGVRQILAEDFANMGFTGYEAYPLKIIDDKRFLMVLEGRIYNLEKSALDKTLRQIADALIGPGKTGDDEFKRFLLAAEGEFVITFYDKKQKRMLLANDIMGRLPLYYFQDEESLIFSRELKFIVPFLQPVAFNKSAILEYLLFGFPFEENTFIEKAGFFPYATIVSFDQMTGKATRESYHSLNIDVCINSGGRKKMAAEMGRIFMEGLSDRAAWVDKNKTIVSLSGGFDSRGTLAGMKKAGLCPIAVTAQSDEEHSARLVAVAIGAEVYAIPQGHNESGPSFGDIVFLKDGLDCHPNLAQLYQNLQDLRDRFGGDIVYFTGIYGGEITRHSHPTAGLKSLASLVRYLLSANDSYKYSTKKVSEILQMPAYEIRNHLLMHLNTFPEKNIRRKYARFRHEYDRRFAGEAEDRNRFYFWTISPFFTFPFFTYVMSIDERKKTSWLFRDFLFAIDPNTCMAKYFNYGLPLNNRFILWGLAFAERMVRHVVVKNLFRRLAWFAKKCRGMVRGANEGNKSAVQAMRDELLTLLEGSGPVSNIFNNPELPAIIRREDDAKGLERLRIVFTYVDRVTRWHAGLRE